MTYELSSDYLVLPKRMVYEDSEFVNIMAEE